MLNFASNCARDAGLILIEKFGRANLRIEHKGAIDLVTEADLASEKLIVERIRNSFPRHEILAEESGLSKRATSEHRWIIDPLDGTTNYAHGYPCFCVSIALEHDGKIVLGVVYDPTRDELFAAEYGQGATLNMRRLRVSNVTNLNEALLVTGFPYDVRDRGDFARHFTNFMNHAQAVRRDGSAALDLAYVAAGRFDGFWEEGLRAWDVAAGALIVEEAGGRVSRYDDSPYDIYSPPIVASNAHLHRQMLEVLRL